LRPGSRPTKLMPIRRCPSSSRAQRSTILGDRRTALFPALAIPIEKKRTFECPDEHLASLRRDLPRLKKLVAIGWRATEQHFLDVLAEDVGDQPVEILTACGNTDESHKAWERLAGCLAPLVKRKDQGVTGLGFSDLVRSGTIDEFLAP
jgi:hypothetical protein